MGSSPNINYPQQPSYGEGMADAMKAQMEQLLGQGDYAQMYADAGFAGGNLGDIVAGVEGPIRQQTAQVDTDVLRQTLLGTQTKVVKDPETGKYGIPGAEVVKDENGNEQTAGGGRYQIIMTDSGYDYTPEGALRSQGTGRTPAKDGESPTYTILDTTTGGTTGSFSATIESANDGEKALGEAIKQATDELNKLKNTIEESGEEAVTQQFQFTNPNTGEPLKEGEVVREGDGMIDLLGDRRKALDPTTGLESDRMAGFDADGNFLGLSALAEDIQRGNLSRQREADLSDVERLSDRYSDVMDQFRPGTQQALTDASAVLEAQKDTLTGAGSIGTPSSTFGGDMTAGTMRAASIGDAPTLSADTSYKPSASVTGGTFDVSTSYAPSAGVTGGTFDTGTSYTAQGVADPLKLSAATSYTPSAGVEGATYTAAQAGDPMQLTAATKYDPSASVTGDGYTATANLEGGNVGADSLRAALLADAETALSQGLTDREQARISNAARARQTMMGRTFDQSGAIAEAQALVAEDNARRMQNRAFAGDTLGRESDIQRSDLDRGLQANIRNQDSLNRAAEFGASQNMQAQLANQAATNQARQAGMTAGLSQEALAAQQKQAQEFANQAASNRAREFGASTSMDAQRLNQAATNQALSQGLSAELSQEALAAQQAQAKALADASAANRASEFGIGAGLDQEARANQSALQADLANQQATNQAAQFKVSAGMDQQAQANQAALQAQLANQQATNQAAQFGVGADMEQDALRAQLGQQTNLAQAELNQQAAAFDADAAQRASQLNQAQAQQANQFDVGATMDAQRLNEQLKQAGTLGYVDAATRLAALEDQYALDPFAAILGPQRAVGGSLQSGGQVFGQANYGLNSGPQYLNPEAGLGYISQMAANDANMYAANQAANASRSAGIFGGLGSLGGGLLGGLASAGKIF